MEKTENCDSCGMPLSCPFEDCRWPHYCKACRVDLPHWSKRKSWEKQESNVGYPCWVKHQETQDIQYVKHHPMKSQVKVVYGPDYVITTRNDTIIRETLPLPNYPYSEQTGVWKLAPYREIYGRDPVVKKDYVRAMGNAV